ncbi:hypothetical protein UVI_02018810 [Ustilaginoidea virens]|uniref:Uncharacterized protein n=1 Tax=Ustilaginoidea virens TaxID=1159556 RepID=A0A1B5KXD5_USTVR|nr:hypothetical protein UVI_02018810 [Ustilaginoidea virens]
MSRPRKIIIDDDGIYWGDRPIDSLAAGRLNMVLYPKAVALSVWTFVKSLCRETYQGLAEAVGSHTEPPQESSWQTITANRIVKAQWPKAAKAPNSAEKPSDLPVSASFGDVVGPYIGADSQLDPRLKGALRDAFSTFTKNWKPLKEPPGRGCVRVDGLVELQGTVRVMGVYVVGWYDPKRKAFVSIQTGLKHVLPLQKRLEQD